MSKIEYGEVKEFDNFCLWYEPITDEVDGFVLRNKENESIIKTYVNVPNAVWEYKSRDIDDEGCTVYDIYKCSNCGTFSIDDDMNFCCVCGSHMSRDLHNSCD